MRRKIELIDRALAHARRDTYLAARDMTTPDLMAGMLEYLRWSGYRVTEPEARVQLHVIANLVSKRG